MLKVVLCGLALTLQSSVIVAQNAANRIEQLRSRQFQTGIRATAQAKNVLDYGAVGDGNTDDTAAVQAAISAAAGSTAYFPGGHTFSVTNLTLPDSTNLEGDGYGSKIIARSGGSNQYLIASEAFMASGRNTVDGSQGIVNLNIDGAGIKGSVVVLRAMDSHVTRNWIYGSNGATTIGADSNIGADLLLTTHGLDGTDIVSGLVMCNGYIDHNRLGMPDGKTALYNMRTYDPNFKTSDWFLESNWMEGAQNTISDVLIMDGGGWIIRGNHMYGAKYTNSAICIPINSSDFSAGCDLTLQEPNFNTLVADNYFEDSVGYQLSGRDGKYSVFGPGNMVGQTGHPHSAYFVAGFGNYANDTIVSLGNFYYDAQMIHDYSDPSKVLTSMSDVFSNTQPVINIGTGHVNLWSMSNNGTSNGSAGTQTGSATSANFGSDPTPKSDGTPVGISNTGDGEFIHLYDQSTLAGSLAAWAGNYYMGSTGNYNARIGSFGTGNTQIFGGNKVALTLRNNAGTEQIQFFGNTQQITGLQGLDGQNLAACKGQFVGGDLWMSDANGNCVDSGVKPETILRAPAVPVPGKLICWTSQGKIGSCSTPPDRTGGCSCR